MRTLIMVLLFARAATGAAFADNTGGIRGTVTSLNDGRAIAGATIEIHSATVDESTKTDARGGFTFLSLPPGPIKILVGATGYQSDTLRACVQTGVFRTLPIRLWFGRAGSQQWSAMHETNKELIYHPYTGAAVDRYSYGPC